MMRPFQGNDNEAMSSEQPDKTTAYAKTSRKTLQEQIDVVAEFHAHQIRPERIAYRTGIALALVRELIEGDSHQALFRARLARHRRARRDQRLRQSRRHRGIRQADLQDAIEREYREDLDT